MRPSNAVRTVWDAEAIDTSHLDFRPIQKIATIHASSGFIWEIPIQIAQRDKITIYGPMDYATYIVKFRTAPASGSRSLSGLYYVSVPLETLSGSKQ